MAGGLRAEPHVVRLLLRRLKMWDAVDEGVNWEAEPKTELLRRTSTYTGRYVPNGIRDTLNNTKFEGIAA